MVDAPDCPRVCRRLLRRSSTSLSRSRALDDRDLSQGFGNAKTVTIESAEAALSTNTAHAQAAFWICHLGPENCRSARFTIPASLAGTRSRCPQAHRFGTVRAGVARSTQHRRQFTSTLGCPDDDRRIWHEARAYLGVGANAAAVVLCRKLLFHIAVAHGLPAKNKPTRAPGLPRGRQAPRGGGHCDPSHAAVVDRVKDLGSDAIHELSPSRPSTHWTRPPSPSNCYA